MFRNEASIKADEQILKLWRRKLRVQPEEARKEAKEKIEKISRNFSQTELDQFYNQMMNGAAVPSDFSNNTRA